VGEIALRLAVGLRFRRRLAALLAAFGDATLLGFAPRRALPLGADLGFGLPRGLPLPYLLKPLLLVGHPIGHLVAALVAVELVLLRIGGLGGLSQRSTSASSSASRFFIRS